MGSISGAGKFPGVESGKHSSILAWKTPWTEKPGGLQSMGSQRVRHDLATENEYEIKIIFGNNMFDLNNVFLLRFRIDASFQMPKEVNEDPDVTGKNRYKYFERQEIITDDYE